MKRSRRELSIDMVIVRGIFKNNQITHYSCFIFKPKTQAFVFTVLAKVACVMAKARPKPVLEELKSCFDFFRNIELLIFARTSNDLLDRAKQSFTLRKVTLRINFDSKNVSRGQFLSEYTQSLSLT